MKSLKNACAILVLTVCMPASAALAADPVGRWIDADGFAHISVDICDGRLWGVIVWEKKPGVDRHNPDATKRGRPTMGMPVLMNMKPASNQDRWEGQIYNSQDGKTYQSKVYLKSADVLRVEGCVMGFLCGGQDWRRVAAPAAEDGSAAAPAAATRSQPAVRPPGMGPAPVAGGAAPPPAKAAGTAAATGTSAATSAKAAPAPGGAAAGRTAAVGAPSPVCSAVLDANTRATQ